MRYLLQIIAFVLPGFLCAQWVQIPSPTANALNNLYFINDTVGYAGDDNSAIVTYDGGRNWSMNTGFTALYKACYLDSLNGFGITSTALYQTTDGGANWSNISDSVKINRFSILDCVNGKVFVVGNLGMIDTAYWYVSDDAGASWELRYQTDSMFYSKAQFFDDQNITGVAWSNIANPPRMVHFYKSTDGGHTWDTYSFHPGINYGYTLHCADPDTCFIGSVNTPGLGGSGGMGITRLIFSSLATSGMHSKQDTLLHFLEGWDQSLFVGGMQFLMVSPDRGITWINQDISFLTGWQRLLIRCHVFSDSSAVITGENGSIIFTENFGLGLTEHNPASPSFSVFPNPATGHQDISVTRLTSGTTCTIELFDLRGNKVKEVFSGTLPDNNLNIRVDLNDIAAGSYIYRVQTEAGVSQKKIVVH